MDHRGPEESDDLATRHIRDNFCKWHREHVQLLEEMILHVDVMLDAIVEVEEAVEQVPSVAPRTSVIKAGGLGLGDVGSAKDVPYDALSAHGCKPSSEESVRFQRDEPFCRIPPVRDGDVSTPMDLSISVESDTPVTVMGEDDGKDLDALQLMKGLSNFAEEPPPLFSCSADNVVTAVSTALVVANTVFVGCQVTMNLERAKVGEKEELWLEIADRCFTFAFFCELSLRWYVHRSNVIFGEEKWWNLFDHVLTVSSVLEWVSGVLDWSFVRSLRVFRAVRVGRLFRVVRFVRELRVMVASVLCSMASFMWACIFLCAVLYFFSVFIALDVTSHLRSYGVTSVDQDTLSKYGSIASSMLTLFMAITGGTDWSELLAPLQLVSPYYTLFFILYVAFTVFGVMNILTAVFVDAAGRISEIDRDLVIQEQMAQATSTAKALKKVFQAADRSGSNLLDVGALEAHFRNREVVAYLRFLELDVLEARGLFQLLDVEGKHVVDIDEFVVGMMRLKGAAKGVDVATIMYENKKIFVRLVAFMKYVEDNFLLMRKAMNIELQETARANGCQRYIEKEEILHRRNRQTTAKIELQEDGSTSMLRLKRLFSNTSSPLGARSNFSSERHSKSFSTVNSESSSERNYQQ